MKLTCLILTAVLMAPVGAQAQDRADESRAAVSRTAESSTVTRIDLEQRAADLRAIESDLFAVKPAESRVTTTQYPIGPPNHHWAVRTLIILGGAAGGFLAGGYTGAVLENKIAPCHCDDPGLRGAVIGAPIGAITGGVLAAILTR